MDGKVIRILADENIRTDICRYLKSIEVDIVSINDCKKKGVTDSEVICLAISEKRILLTCDRDFNKKFRNLEHPGILWLRTSPKYQLEAVKKIIPIIKDKDINGQIIRLTKEDYVITKRRKSYLPAKEIRRTY
jgi:predicted nuclease of predicted toxin-antitoxin system